MDFRTVIKIDPSRVKISYNDPVMFIGSCFSASIGKKFEVGHMPVMINPSGTVYNPVSVCNTFETITSGKEYKITDLHNYKGSWLSFNHYTDFSSEDPDEVLYKINTEAAKAADFLTKASYLFVTFGTARVFIRKESGKIVSNCHKIPASEFTHKLLTVVEVVQIWKEQLVKLSSLFPRLKVVFTVSPVRHWKDGAHGNQVSKAVLMLATEELLAQNTGTGYFPSYEILMDDLRDYRYYDNDMLHPSKAASDYVWEMFTGCYFDEKTKKLWNEVAAVTRAADHIVKTGSASATKDFARTMLDRIEMLEKKEHSLRLSGEKEYFNRLLSF